MRGGDPLHRLCIRDCKTNPKKKIRLSSNSNDCEEKHLFASEIQIVRSSHHGQTGP